MAWNLPDNGQVFRLGEVVNGASLDVKGRAVRVMGRLESYDYMKQRAIIHSLDRSCSHQLIVDTRLIEPFEAKPRSIFQFLGEMDHCVDHQLILRARVVRCVDGVDVGMYYKALDEQRRFFERRKDSEIENVQT